MTKSNEAPITIDVFTDVTCPWCFIGTQRLERAIESLGVGARVEQKHHAVILQPDVPAAGLDLHAMLTKKFDGDPSAIFARVESAARESGIPLDLSKQRYTYPTERAHTLLRHAATKNTQKSLEKALFQTYFLEAKDISNIGVLVEIAVQHGFTADEAMVLLQDANEIAQTHDEADAARRQGITGVPFFVLNGKFAVSGGQPEKTFRDAIERAMSIDP